MSFYSSTPAIKPSDTAEGSKGTFSFGSPIPEQSEVSDGNGSPSEESQEEESGEEQELEQWNVPSLTESGPPPIQSGVISSSKGSFSLGTSQDETVLKPSLPMRITPAADSSQTKSTPQLAAVGTFPAVDKSGGVAIKPAGSQTIPEEPVKPPSGLFLPTARTQVKTVSF